ncbi:helix-turn-helix domain-containing protein [Priestia aryabhattai]|uniref:Helix-turn-helix transcriptional regulator n=1 Tax=Priestia aryabhattai TaxID=412384 RepID=A0ABD7X4T1_PRIAR|nr:helix-turn-helix transcriptional regulator [Priestia aryabhattai]WEA47311.1 helix-turn-helix transcriptional regulator [Priestia aryabhattai]
MKLKNKSTDEKEIKLEIGRRIREQRKANGFKTSQTYRNLDIPRTTYTGYEMGSRTPDPATMKRIANYLNTTVSYLMCETDDPEIKQSTSSFEEILEEKSLTIGGKPLTEEQWAALYSTLKDINEQNEKNTKH